MITAIRQWFGDRPERERRTIVIGASLLLLLLIWMMFWQPLITERARLSKAKAGAQADVEWIQSAATQVQQARRSPRTTLRTSPEITVTRTASAYGLTLSRMEPAGRGRIEVYFESAAYIQLLRFLTDLEKVGLLSDRLTMKRLPESGYVKVRARIVDGNRK